MAMFSIRSSKVASKAAVAMIAACLPLAVHGMPAMMGGGGQSAGCPTAPSSGASGDNAVIGSIAASVCNEAARLPKGASTDDLEAAMAFAVSQSDAKPEQIAAALDRLAGDNYGQQNFAAALKRVRAAYASKRVKRGTSALSGAVAFSSGFTAPSFAGGGGSSNYTQ